jgi:UDP-galactopyranose mutase
LMRQIVSGTSWDRTVQQMLKLIDEGAAENSPALPSSISSKGESTGPSSSRRGKSALAEATFASTVIVGAGPTGLSAAYHLGADAVLLEQNDQIGGWCRSITEQGFTFDYAGHIMFSNDPYVHEMYSTLLGDNVHWQDREAWIFSKQVYTRYPFQGALYGLPADVIKDCVMGAIEARYGQASAPQQPSPVPPQKLEHAAVQRAHANGALNGSAKSSCPELTDCCADGVLESTTRLVASTGSNGNGSRSQASNGNGSRNRAAKKPPTENFEEFIHRVWGRGIAEHFAVPYNRKLWAVPLSEMETSWLGGRVPMPNLEEMIEGALKPVPKPMGPNARFGYPLRGGFQSLMEGFLPWVESQLRLGVRVTAVIPSERRVELSDGSVLDYEHLISTMPLPVLVRSIGDEAPPQVRAAASRLRYVSVRCVHLGVGRENLTEKHWIYYPEETVFHRVFVQGNASPHCNPPGGFGLTCEITYSEYKPLPCDGTALIERCIADCHQVGLFSEADPILVATQVDLPHAYVVYDHERAQNVKLIRDWLLTQNIVLAGRYSEWEYYNSDHAFLAGKKAAEAVQHLKSSAQRLPLDGRNTGSLKSLSTSSS